MMFGVKDYSIRQISLKMLENNKWDFGELEKVDSNIKNDIKEVLGSGGIVFALDKKKIFKTAYLFKIVTDGDNKILIFKKKVSLEEVAKAEIKEFEEEMTTLLGEEVSQGEVVKVIWGDKEIESSKVKIGKWEIPLSFIWLLVGVIFWFLFDDFMLFVIYLCIGVSSGYVIKNNGNHKKRKKSKKIEGKNKDE